MKKIIVLFFSLIIVLLLTACGSKIDGQFTMSSDDTVGAVRHTLVGTDDCEPVGTYTVTCTSGHGALFINDKELFVLAADSYLGEEYTGLVYVESITVRLSQSDVLKARNFNSSKFKLEFTYVDPTEAQESTIQTDAQ